MAAHPALNISGDAERRMMTILFCDLVGSTPISEELDPEDLRDLLSAYRKVCGAVVERMGGSVTKLVGDGLDAHFGYPIDYEDSAQRAVRAALEIVAAVPSLKRDFPQLSVPIEARIGINTGLVVVGDVGAGALREQQSVIGDTPNVAARLQGVAAPGQVVIGEPTHRLVGQEFVFEDLGKRELKGVAEPMNCYRVLAEATDLVRRQAKDAVGYTRLIGRDGEVAILKQNWKRAVGGDGQTVLLTGEAGIGKSRVVESLETEILGDPNVAEVRLYAASVHVHTAFRPIIREIIRLAKFASTDTTDDQLDKLEAMADAHGLDRAEIVPPMAATLNVDLSGRYRGFADPSMIKTRFMAAFAKLIDAVAGDKSLLMIVEDLHWADPSTLEFLDQWVTEVADRRCLLLMTFRPTFETRWRDESHLSTLNLNRLSRVESREVIDLVAKKPLPEEVASTIVQRTDGVPLFIEELTKMVIESGLMADTGDEYVLTGPLPPLAIPDSLQNSLMARLDRLSSVKEVAQIAAAIGRRFGHQLLAAVTQTSEPELEKAMNQLVDAELLQRHGFRPHVEYEFKHALVQDAAYGSMLKSTRQRVHARIGEALAVDPVAKEHEPEVVARHYLRGGMAVKAIPFAVSAGKRALAASAHLEAIEHFSTALDHIEDMTNGRERRRTELDVRMAFGVPLQTVRGYAHATVRQNYERVELLATSLGATAELMPLYYGMARYHMLSAEYDKAFVTGEKLLSAATEAGDQIFLAAGRRTLGSNFFYTGNLERADEELRAVIESGLVEDDYSTARQVDVVDFRVAANSYMGWVAYQQGRPETAREYARNAIEVAEGLTHKFSVAFALCFASWTFQFCGDNDDARGYAQRGLDISRDYGFQFWIGWAEVVLAATGGAPKGMSPGDAAREGLANWAEVGSKLGQTYLLCLTVELLLDAGDETGAQEVLSEAEVFAEESGERFYLSEVLRLKGVLRRATAPKSAEALFRRALEEADDIGARPLALRALLSLGEAPGCEEEARLALKERLLAFTADARCGELDAARAFVARDSAMPA